MTIINSEDTFYDFHLRRNKNLYLFKFCIYSIFRDHGRVLLGCGVGTDSESLSTEFVIL